MSTLPVVEEILRETEIPMSVRQIVEYAGARLPTKSKTPDTVVARDLSMDIKKKGDASLFARTSPGRYTLREFHLRAQREAARAQADAAPAEHADQGASPTPEQRADEGASPTPERSVSAPVPAAVPAATYPGIGAGGDSAPTPVLSAAMREDRAAPLPARKPTDTAEERKTVG